MTMPDVPDHEAYLVASDVEFTDFKSLRRQYLEQGKKPTRVLRIKFDKFGPPGPVPKPVVPVAPGAAVLA